MSYQRHGAFTHAEAPNGACGQCITPKACVPRERSARAFRATYTKEAGGFRPASEGREMLMLAVKELGRWYQRAARFISRIS